MRILKDALALAGALSVSSPAMAAWDPRGSLTMWSTTQIPFLYQRDLAEALGISGDRIRVIQPPVGGNFGRGLDLYPIDIIAALLAMGTSWLSGRSFEVMLLTLAPGGMVEMITITFALGIDIAFVVTCQMWRLLLVMTVMPVTFHYLNRKHPGAGSKV